MKWQQERPHRSGVATVLLSLRVCATLVRKFSGVYGWRTGPSAPAEVGEGSGKAEQREVKAGLVLLLGGAMAWRLGQSLLHFMGKWLVAKPGGPSSQQNGGMIVGGIVVQKRMANSAGGESEARDCGCAHQGRAADRNLDAQRGVNLERRERLGLGLVGLAFATFLAGGLGFLVTYWTGGSNLLLGGLLAMCFGGLGAAAVIWARWLTVQKEAVGPREQASSADEHEAASTDFALGAADIRRRRLLGGMAAGGLGLMGAMVISMFRSLGVSPDAALYSYVWKRGQRLVTVDGNPVSATALPPGGTVIVFPEDSIGSERAQTVLVRVDPSLLRLPEQRTEWAPLGNLAYSRVCTHAGCSVGMYETTNHQLMCPCHQSTFDVLQGATPSGGPAARPLPQLPLYTDKDGNLRAGGGFSEPPGPGFWGMPA